jgi:2'-5' RNA ligase
MENNHKYEYGCLMLKFKVPNWTSFIENLIDKDDIYNDDSGAFGLEKEPHVTVLFGLHDYVKTDDFKNILVPIRHIKCKTNKITCFENPEYDVVKFDIEGNYLHKLNKDLRDSVDYTTSFPQYNPHMTIFYSKKGSGKKYEKTFSIPILVKPTSYLYSYSNGEKEEFFI